MSTVTLWEDGDPLSPSVLNSKLSPLLSSVSGVTGIQVLSDGSSLGTATSLNFVGSSSVSSQAAGQISVLMPTISGTSGHLPKFNSAGTGIVDSPVLVTSAGTIQYSGYGVSPRVGLQRMSGSTAAPQDTPSNTDLGGIDFQSLTSGTTLTTAAIRAYTQSVSSVDPSPLINFWCSENGSMVSVVEITRSAIRPTLAQEEFMQCGTQTNLWSSVNANECIAWTKNNITGNHIRTYLTGSNPNGGNIWTIYSEVLAEAQSLRLRTSGNNESGTLYLINVSSDEAYLSVHTGPVMRIGSNQTRFHSLNVLGLATRALHTISSHSATTIDQTISVDSTSNLTVTLPAPSTVSGHHFTVKRAGAGTLEVNAGSGASIDNVSVYTLASQWSSAQFVSAGTRYLVVASQ